MMKLLLGVILACSLFSSFLGLDDQGTQERSQVVGKFDLNGTALSNATEEKEEGVATEAGATEDTSSAVELVKTFRASENSEEDTEVYWRPWSGQAPEDAVKIDEAMTQCGVMAPVYLGQVYFDPPYGMPQFQAVSMFSRSKWVEPVHQTYAYPQDTNVKILCSTHQDIFTWVPIKEIKLKEVDEDCVLGHAEYGGTFNFGRTNHMDRHVYGYADDTPAHQGAASIYKLHFPYRRFEEKREDFDFLCYKHLVEKRRAES